jgi:hypothetical protein
MKQTQDTTCWITSLSLDVIKYIADFLNHDDAWSLNQTCKPLRKHVPHKCHPLSIKLINIGDVNNLKNGKLAESEALILDGVPLDSTWINLIRWSCPNLKYLFTRYNCNCIISELYFDRLSCVGMFMNINMLNMNDRLSIKLPSAMENFIAHISRIDPVTFKTIPGEYEGRIQLYINTLEKLKSL